MSLFHSNDHGSETRDPALQRYIQASADCAAECRVACEALSGEPGMSDCSHACHEAHKECHQFLEALREGSLSDAPHCADMCARAAAQCERYPDHPACVRCAEVCRRTEAILRGTA